MPARNNIRVRDIQPEPPFAHAAIVRAHGQALRRLTDRQAKRLAFAAMLRTRVGEELPPHWMTVL